MDLKIVELIQKLHSGFFDVIFGGFYYLLNPLVTLFIPIIIYFLIDKKLAYRTGVFYGVTSFFNGSLKELIKRERPFTAHPDKVIAHMENASSSFSMPSGHAMGSIGLLYPATKQFGYVGKGEKKRTWVFIVSAVVVLMIGLSRPYMGAHYLTDILAGWGLGLVIAVGLDFAVTKLGDKFYLLGLALLPVMVLLIFLIPDADSSGVGLAFASVMLIGGLLDHKFIKLDIDVKWWIRIVRVVIAALGAFVLGIIVTAKITESIIGFSLSDAKVALYPKYLAEGVPKEQIGAKIKAFITFPYFMMFFVANTWAFIICPVLFKYVPILFNKITKKA